MNDMNDMKKKTLRALLAAAMAACLLTAQPASPAQAEIGITSTVYPVGWSLSFDGSVNNFLIYATRGDLERETSGFTTAVIEGGSDTLYVRNGLLPAVLGVNVATPTIGNLDISARFGFYPSTNNPNGLRNQFGSQIDMREVFFNVDTPAGSFLVGKTLSLFLGRNILTDMTLLGVGALNPFNDRAHVGTTSNGRIGYGYVYPNFNSAIRYSTPDIRGWRLTVGAYDPSPIRTAGGPDYADVDGARFESELSYAVAGDEGDSLDFWFNSLWQEGQCKGAASTCIVRRQDDGSGGTIEVIQERVTSWGIGGGVTVQLGEFDFTGSAYYGQGLGTTLLLDTDSLGPGGARRNYGYIVQVTYDISEKLNTGISYGSSFASPEHLQDAGAESPRIEDDLGKRRQSLLDLAFRYEVNENVTFIAEYGFQEDVNFEDYTQEIHIFSAGGFFFF